MFKTSLLIIINVSFYFMNILIFGCAGFIGINLTHHFLKKKHKVFGVDKLTYASNINEINLLKKNINFKFFKLDIKSKQIERIIKMLRLTQLPTVNMPIHQTTVEHSF